MAGYQVGKVYNRQEDIHRPAKALGLPSGNPYEGITRVGGDQFVFWNPFKNLYANRWIREPIEFIYSGRGNIGDMTETAGNAHLLNCEATQKDALVFYKKARDGADWLYLGAYQVINHSWNTSPDTLGNWRRDIRFQFLLTESATNTISADELPDIPARQVYQSPSEAQLWQALTASPGGRTSVRRRRTRLNRNKRESDPLKTAYVRARTDLYKGACELCDSVPDWLTEYDKPHYQAHHLDPDIDEVDWIAAICGTCHDRLHHGKDRAADTNVLRTKIVQRQLEQGRPIYEPGPRLS